VNVSASEDAPFAVTFAVVVAENVSDIAAAPVCVVGVGGATGCGWSATDDCGAHGTGQTVVALSGYSSQAM
jgi:hypothetical protein